MEAAPSRFDGVPCQHKLSLATVPAGSATASRFSTLPSEQRPLTTPTTFHPKHPRPCPRPSIRVFPKIRALGLHKDLGVVLHYLNSTGRDRWPSKEIFDKVVERLADPNFEVTVQLDDL